MAKNYYNCIYMYTNIINNKKYIGQTKNFNRRHSQHIRSANYNDRKDHNLPIHMAILKYGIENFKINILAENVESQDKLNEYEQFFIKRYNTLTINGIGYNVASGGHNGNPYAGKTEEELNEIKRKLSEANKGKKWSEESRIKLSKSLKGHEVTETTRIKMSESHKGKQYDEDRIEQLRKIANENPNHGMKNKHHTQKTKDKMSEIKGFGKYNPLSKLIVRYNPKTKQYKLYFAMMDAKRDGFDCRHICKCCKGQRKTHKKYKWFYVDDFYKFMKGENNYES